MSNNNERREFLARALAAGGMMVLPGVAGAQAKVIRIGVLTDMNGPLSPDVGPGSLAAAQLAVEDFAKLRPDIKVEVISADMQNKPDITVSIAKEWMDNGGVDLVTEVPISAGALALGPIVSQRDKLAIFTSASSTVLTGTGCGTNHLQWTIDTYAMSKAVVESQLKNKGMSWFFITADTAFGQGLEADATSFIKKAGGTVVGSVRHPFPGNTDFSSYLLQAQASGAQVIGIANSGADAANCIKQAAEFGITAKGQRLAGLYMEMNVVRSVGLEAAKGVLCTESFYWDLDDNTRAFSRRFAERMRGRMPTQQQAGEYSAVWNYLNAVAAIGVDNAKKSGRAVIAQMRAKPMDDPLFGRCTVRADGRVIHPMYVFEVKAPAESKSPYDVYHVRVKVPPEQAFRPIGEGACPLVKA